MRINTFFNAKNRSKKNIRYLKAYKKGIDHTAILLEAGQGKHINGNMFAFLRCLNENDKWSNLVPYVVATEETHDEIVDCLKKRGIKRYSVVDRDGDKYMEVLATAKYLATDNSFPGYFVKRKEQIYINTWHGTPLKKLGRSDIENSTSIGNVQKNFLAADYLLFPNTYTKEVMMKDYMVDRLFKHESILIDYPRNDALYDDIRANEIIEKYGLSGKRVIAYMPTWRGSARTAFVTEQLEDAEKTIKLIEGNLAEDEILYVNLHFLIGNKIDISECERVRFFPPEYETYDFLSICDTLITDYSSVMMDFAPTGKSIIMYMYDYEQYMNERGFYFDIRKLPFKMAYDENELLLALKNRDTDYEMDNRFLGGMEGKATKAVLELLLEGRTEGLKIEKHNEKRNTKAIYVGNLQNSEVRYLADKALSQMTPDDKARSVLIFDAKFSDEVMEYLKSLDRDIYYYRCIGGHTISFIEYYYLYQYRYKGKCAARAEVFFKREFERLFCDIAIDEAEMLMTNSFDRMCAFSNFENTIFDEVPEYFYRRPNDVFYVYPERKQMLLDRYDSVRRYPDNYGLEAIEDELCFGIKASAPNIKVEYNGDSVTFVGHVTLVSPLEVDSVSDFIRIGPRNVEVRRKYPAKIANVSSEKVGRLYRIQFDFSMSLSAETVYGLAKNNIFVITVKIENSEITVPVSCQKGIIGRGKKINLNEIGFTCEINRSSRFFRIILREKRVSDRIGQRLKILLAFFVSLITPWHKPLFLYEKNCNGYEESASVLFEKLVDSGRKDVCFILSSEYPYMYRVADIYRRQLIKKYSFAHYYNLFSAKALMSTEALGHSLETNSRSLIFKKYILEGKKDYVFLQHGVMYMVSLAAEQRNMFSKKKKKGSGKVVVSSKREALHFMDYTNYTEEDLYICGLLKFDRSIRNEYPDKIVIMPTWRPWEFADGFNDVKNTGYYRMMNEMVESVPLESRDKLIVLPHPLIVNQFKQSEDDPVSKYCITEESYDDILKNTKLLITDYSSISYDAFYRGANVIFYWKNLDECMAQYGQKAYLMLDEELAFGDVCYDESQLPDAIIRQYSDIQEPVYVERFSEIVEFHDGHNTDRFIEMATRDGII